MQKNLIITYGFLVLLTVATAFISSSMAISIVGLGLIMGISAIKFLLVAYQFMEIRKAHIFWKTSLLSVLGLLLLVLIFS